MNRVLHSVLGIIGVVIGLMLVVFLVASIATSTLPWNWRYWYDYNRQVTNVTYIHAGGGTVGLRNKVLGLNMVQGTNGLGPSCEYNGDDLFNTSGSSNDRPVNGVTATIFAGGSRQTVTVPNNKIHQVRYVGKTLRVNFAYTRVVLYYDYNWDSLWTDSGSWGPKQHVINCMQALALGEKMQIGMKYATFFVPTHPGPKVKKLIEMLPSN